MLCSTTRFATPCLDELARLPGNATFTVAEFAGDTATIFEIYRDEHGTPTRRLVEVPRTTDGALVVDDDEPDQLVGGDG